MTIQVVLDTDIGTDVDDLLALSVLLASPEFDILGITCAYGDTLLRAKIAARVLQLVHRQEIPVFVGAQTALLNKRPVFWEGHEGVGIIEPDDAPFQPSEEDASDFLIRIIRQHPGEIHLLAIAPLTNLALAFIREPKLPSMLAGITMMGGVVRAPDRLDLPVVEHNIQCDPDAAHVVFHACTAAHTPLTIVPLDLTTLVRLTPAGVATIRARDTRLHTLIADQVEAYSWYQKFGSTALHDPLVVAAVIDPSLLTTIPVDAEVELKGEHTLGMTVFKAAQKSGIRLAIGVDADRAAAWIVRRITEFSTD